MTHVSHTLHDIHSTQISSNLTMIRSAVLQVCKDPVIANIEVNLPDCSHTSASCHNAIEYDNNVVDSP